MGRVKAKEKYPQLGAQHRANVAALAERVVEDNALVEELLRLPWPRQEGAFVDMPSKLLRLKALRTALQHGRPLAVIDEFEPLIVGDGSRGSLPESSHMARLIPLYGQVLDTFFKKKRYISLGIIFDGLSDKGNWVSILARGVLEGESMVLEQHLLDMPHTSSPYNHAV